MISASMFGGVVMGSSTAHHAVCAAVSEWYVSYFVFFSFFLFLFLRAPPRTQPLQGSVKCADGMVCIAILALAMVFNLPAALHQPYGWFGANRTFDVHQRCVEAQGFNAVVQWRLVQRRVGRKSCLIGTHNLPGNAIEIHCFMIMVLVVIVMLRDRTS